MLWHLHHGTKLLLLQVDAKGNLIAELPWLSKFTFTRPNDMELGPNGELYMLEYGAE